MTKVFLICTGLGHINRGYESFMQECFDALSETPELDITLFKGGGPTARKQIALWNLPRTHPFAIWLGKKSGKGAYVIEQLTFLVSLLPHLTRQKPEVVYFSDTNLGKMLWRWRRVSRQKFILLFRNGSPMQPPYPLWDWTQQLVSVHLEAALAAGQPPDSQGLLPPGVHMEPEMEALSPADRAALRRSLGLPEDSPIVLSVGAVNKSYKRMDYVVSEVAALPEPRPFLVMLGQREEESLEICDLAAEQLGSTGYVVRTVPRREVDRYYQAADVFVLASLTEGFGRVYVEALSWGLPCLAHDSALTRDILGDCGLRADFTQPGALTALLAPALSAEDGLAARRRRHLDAFNRFNWQQLRPQYLAMLQRCAALSPRF